MPIGGILMAVMAGWIFSKESARDELKMESEKIFIVWRFLIRFVAPVTVAAIFISNLR